MHLLEAEVVVIGGGPSGICAAVAAARKGMKTILLGNRPVLGGNSSSEVRVWTRGSTGGGNIFSEEMGVWGQFKMKNLYANLEGNPIFWSEILLDNLLNEKNIQLLLNTHVTEIKMSGADITSIEAYQLNTEKHFIVNGKVFIDCTGDGTIAFKANIPFRIGNDSTIHTMKDSEKDIKQKPFVQGCSILYYIKKTNSKVNFIAPDYAYDIEYMEKIINTGGRVVNETFSGSDYWWFEYGGKLDTIGDNQEILIELKRLVMGVWNYIKNSGKFDADNITLEWIGNLPGKRESRRFLTDYVLTFNDVTSGKTFFDSSFYGGWYIDHHPSEGIFSKDAFCEQRPIGLYNIPLRSLYNSKVNNLLLGGRIIGVDRDVFASSRIMNTCAISGEVSGTLAWYIVKEQLKLSDLNEEMVFDLRQTLLKEDIFILDCKNEDEDDLAKQSFITASSVGNKYHGDSFMTQNVSDGYFITLPKTVNAKSFKLLIDCLETTIMDIEFYNCHIPSRLVLGEYVGTYQLEIKEQNKQWVEIEFPLSDYSGFVTVNIKPNKNLFIHTTQEIRTGIISGTKELPAYHTPCVDLKLDGIYDAQNVINGYNRPYNFPNLWVSDEESFPWIELKWITVQEVSQIRLYFNPDLAKEFPSSKTENHSEHHKLHARTAMPSELVKEFEIYAMQNGEYVKIFSKKNNCERLVVVNLEEKTSTDSIKIVIVDTYGSKKAEIFEIRIY